MATRTRTLDDRDRYILSEWLIEEYGATLEQLQYMLKREQQRIDRQSNRQQATQQSKFQRIVSVSTARGRLKAWEDLGIVESDTILSGQKWLWANQAGIDQLGKRPYDFRQAPSVINRPHIRLINQARFYLEYAYQQQGTEVEFRSARQQKYDNGQDEQRKNWHETDDDILIPDQGIMALEVELTQKLKSRMQKILRELEQRYNRILYYCNNKTIRFVPRQLDEVGFTKEQQDRFTIRHVDELEFDHWLPEVATELQSR